MKYFFISDLHGCDLALVKQSLAKENFNPDTDTLVVVGDIVDRGTHSAELLEYLCNLPHMIPIIGNHDYRDFELLFLDEYWCSYDTSNGVEATLNSLFGQDSKSIRFFYQAMLENPSYLSAHSHKLINLFRAYVRSAVYAVEWENLLATHAWRPARMLDAAEWAEVIWTNSHRELLYWNDDYKPMIVGHWFAAEIRASFIDHIPFDDQNILKGLIDWSPVTVHNVTFIDTCTSFSGKLNVVVRELDDEPIVYKPDKISPKATISTMSLSEWNDKCNLVRVK